MEKKQKVIFFTGGGSLGHVTPNLTLIKSLKNNKNYRLCYIGSYNGVEKSIVHNANVKYFGVCTAKIKRHWALSNLFTPIMVLIGIMQSLIVFLEHKPNLIYSKGGFVSLPPVIAAKLLGVKVIIHESDLSIGLANRICGHFADKIHCTFNKNVYELFSRKNKFIDKYYPTGVPLRSEFVKELSHPVTHSFIPKPNGKKMILIFGGSLGSESINAIIDINLKELVKNYVVIHIRGRGKLNDSNSTITNYHQFEFMSENISHYMSNADVIISRAGMTSILEIASCGNSAILIPLPKTISRGDQIENANFFSNLGCFATCNEDEFAERIYEELNEFEINKSNLIENVKKLRFDYTGNSIIKDIHQMSE
ncbi:UDP-N-acetylglucosamine--N-acetylmuramyl-(pentapeptide) pyrophosphoryl-undecaprenol N-acetylglucosamine transferase [Vibrio hyugaensis]|uniref:UDP-N-acetylglucosamine--N-acetylmuramyl- (pentapeptide) pyrophosphoryl-undecaprenol N-acetylglucosamine transferase n=1 Tax=Vibrio hyugaensis TaxID=1534743 RepID=UPI000CE3D2EB|nr:UDP-N-acetylglucosamine--N-acetylmuramyl-(pentapeptide) pyrophosphoryl-undecaprenol N-acetylglucosamine transferase [Vibrio hyugaensis]